MQNFIENFQNQLSELPLTSTSSLLVAVSGGVDSMVLCDLLLKTNRKFAVAHANFQLRSTDSEQDELFVKKYCERNQLKFFSKKFNVKEYKQSGNFSTQMAARDLRYEWFQKLCKDNLFDFLLTAHNLDDSFETFMLNLSRGTGLEGLTGIKKRNGQTLRPLLSYSKTEILQYASKNEVNWREDSSNSSLDYTRNKIRHKITPVLEEIHPTLLKNFQKTQNYIQSDASLLKHFVQKIKTDLFIQKDEQTFISIDQLKALPVHNSIFYYLFSPYGFQHPFEIEKLLNSRENGEIRSHSHRLLKNRDQLVLTEIVDEPKLNEIQLSKENFIEKQLYLKLLQTEQRDFSATESLDSEQIQFPLRLRKAKPGDEFVPLGMKGTKKISKFFKDEKYSKWDKKNAWLLVDKEDQILYIVGKRIDERFKITEHTHKFLNIYLC